MEQGWDPEVKQFFKKIISTISYGLIWLMAMATAGIYFRLAWQDDKPLLYTILFYVVAAFTLIILLRYYYYLWRK